MSTLRIDDPLARHGPEQRERRGMFPINHLRAGSDEADRGSPRDWSVMRPLWPKQRGTGGWAAAAVALHGLVLFGLMATRPSTVAPVHVPTASASLRWVQVRPRPLPLPSRSPTSARPTPSASLSPPPSVAPAPPTALPIPDVILHASGETPSMNAVGATATATATASANATASAATATATATVAIATIAPTTDIADSAPTTNDSSPPPTDRVNTGAPVQGRPLHLSRSGPPGAVPDRSPSTPSPDQPPSLPANHSACQNTQTTRYYPALLRERGVQGQVRLRVKVDEHGRAAEVIVAGGSGWRLLDEAARRVAESCPYIPARRGDQQVASWIEYAVRFALMPAEPGSL